MSNDNDLLGRLDERTKSIQLVLEKMENDLRTNNEMQNRRVESTETRILKKITEIEDDIKKNYVRNDRFDPIQKIVYGVVGLILTSVVGAVIAMVVTRPPGG